MRTMYVVYANANTKAYAEDQETDSRSGEPSVFDSEKNQVVGGASLW